MVLLVIYIGNVLTPLKDLLAEDKHIHNSMFVPIILGSNKTTVSVATGNNEYWPLYMSIGNICNNVQQAHCNGVILLGFLAIPKCICLGHFNKNILIGGT
jgi:Plavaka transposase